MSDSKKEYFKLRKKEALQDVQNAARSFVEDEACVNRFANAAWAIAYRYPGDAECLYGSKAGGKESLMVLQRVAANAVRIVTVFEHMRRAYNSGVLTQEKLSRITQLINQTDNPVEITDNRTKHRRENCKVHLKSVFLAIVGGAFGCLLATFLKSLVCALSLL